MPSEEKEFLAVKYSNSLQSSILPSTLTKQDDDKANSEILRDSMPATIAFGVANAAGIGGFVLPCGNDRSETSSFLDNDSIRHKENTNGQRLLDQRPRLEL